MGRLVVRCGKQNNGVSMNCVECGTIICQMGDIKIISGGTSTQGDVFTCDRTINTARNKNTYVDTFPGNSVFVVFEDTHEKEQHNSQHIECIQCGSFIGWSHGSFEFILKKKIL